jgi:hypothetical protein
MVLHLEMMSRAFVAISQFERLHQKQAQSIPDLNAQLTAQEETAIARRRKRPEIHFDEQALQKQFEQTMHRILVQNETIRNLNTRIQQFIAQTVLASSRNQNSVSEEDVLLMQQENLRSQIKVDLLRDDLENAKDDIFKLKHKIVMIDARNDFIQT